MRRCTAPFGLNAEAIVHVREISVIAEIDDSAKFPTEIFDSCPGPGAQLLELPIDTSSSLALHRNAQLAIITYPQNSTVALCVRCQPEMTHHRRNDVSRSAVGPRPLAAAAANHFRNNQRL
jgi:hypothetical protein